MSKVNSFFAALGQTIRAKAVTIVVWIVIVVLIYVAVWVNGYERAQSIAALAGLRVTGGVKVSLGSPTQQGTAIDQVTGDLTYAMQATIQNTSSSEIDQPIQLVLGNLANGQLSNDDGVTTTVAPLGDPFVIAKLPAGSTALAPGQSVTVTLDFLSDKPHGISFTPRILTVDRTVQDKAIMQAAGQLRLADALADISDPNTASSSDSNKADTATRVDCATEFVKLLAANAAPYRLPVDAAMTNLYGLHKDAALAPIATGELAALGEASDATLKTLVTNLGDGDPDVRGASSGALAQIAALPTPIGAEAINLVVQAVGVAGEKTDALTTLAAIGKPAAPALVQMLATADSDFTQKLIDMLATIGDPVAIPTIEEETNTTPPDPAVRRIALLGLATIVNATIPAVQAPAPAAAPAKPGAAPAAPASPPGPSPQDIATCMSAAPILIAAVNNPADDSRARAQCALAIGRLGTPAAIAALVRALGDVDSKIQQAATNGLASVGPKAIPMLAQAVHSPTESVRTGAATALGSIGTDQAVSTVASALGDPSANVRRAACEALGISSSKAAIGLLIARLSDQDGSVAGAARSSLESIGQPAVVPLVAELGSANQAATFYASQALEGMGADMVGAQVTAAAISGSPSQKVWCAVVLGQVHDTNSRDVLTKLASNPDPKIKFAAGQALDQIGGALPAQG